MCVALPGDRGGLAGVRRPQRSGMRPTGSGRGTLLAQRGLTVGVAGGRARSSRPPGGHAREYVKVGLD